MKIRALAVLLLSLFASLTFAAQPFVADVPRDELPADLRLYNGGATAVVASVSCGGRASALTVEPHASVDVASEELSCGGMVRVTAERPLLLLRLPRADGDQQIVIANDACATPAIQLPASGCRFGVATAAVAPVAGASYSWAIEGGSFLSGLGTDRVTVSLGNAASAKVTVVVVTPSCTSTGSGVITLRDAATISSIRSDSGNAGQPLTITWSYPSGDPISQTLSGSDFATPVSVPAAQRSYTYTPSSEGDKEVTLVASFAAASVGRGRVAGRNGVSASACSSARASATYRVNGCVMPDATISVPVVVQTGSSFIASVPRQPGTTVTWTIKNGTPSTATGERVTITAGVASSVDLAVRVAAGETCVATAQRSVNLVTAESCADPTAVVSAGEFDCNGGTVKISFTGKPPFTGVWSDGAPLTSYTMTATRAVSKPGSYTLGAFADANCKGTTYGSADFPQFVPWFTVALAGGNCDTSTLIAKFHGVPPFTGTWTDGVSFVTNQDTIERKMTAPGRYSLNAFSDKNCVGNPRQPFAVDVEPAPTATLSLSPYSSSCFSPTAGSALLVEITGNGPHIIVWSDGFVQTAPGTPAMRIVSPAVDTTYSVVSVQTSTCTARVVPGSVTVKPLWLPTFRLSSSYACPGGAGSATLDHAIRDGAAVTWSVDNGSITGGQGTATVSFKANAPGKVKVTASVTMGSCSMGTSQDVTVFGSPGAPLITLDPTTIKAGGSTIISVTTDENTGTAGLNNTRGDKLEPYGDCVGHTCKSKYTNTTGAGQSTITVQYTGQCYDGIHQASTQLTITP